MSSEAPSSSSITFDSVPVTDNEMTYVINLEDGGGQEFFLSTDGQLVLLTAQTVAQPQAFRSYKATAKKIGQIRDRYPSTCRIYALEIGEFEHRQQALKNEFPSAPSSDSLPVQ